MKKKEEKDVIISSENTEMYLYAVRNKEGEWLRSKGYSGYGTSWVDDISKARLYFRSGYAKARISFWSKNYPDFGTPELIRLKVTELQALNIEKELAVKDKKKEIENIKNKMMDLTNQVQNTKNMLLRK